MSSSVTVKATDPPPKRVKVDVMKDLRKGTKLELLQVSDLDNIFLNYNKFDFDIIESSFSHEHHNEYIHLQFRLLVAQQARQAELSQFWQTNFKDKPKAATARKLCLLLGNIANSPEIQDQKVKDAIRYREATCVGYAAFSQHAGQCVVEMKALAGDLDPVKYYEMLVEASERHLASTTTTTPDVKPAMSMNDPYSNEYLRGQVVDFIVKKENLVARAIPWEQIDDLGIDLKRTLHIAYECATTDKPAYQSAPPGILLHGDQGSGKTSIVESFAAHKDLILYNVGGSVHGGLRGQSEKLIEYVFDAIREEATKKPCVLLFDEADSLLGGEHTASAFEGMVKRLWGDLISANIPCFVFGTTNKPWSINMKDYGRRFTHKIHVKMPNEESRKQIVKYGLPKFWHIVDDQGMHDIAKVSETMSANDIVAAIKRVAQGLFVDMLSASKWAIMDKNGHSVHVPAIQNEEHELTTHDKLGDACPRPLTTAMLVEFFATGKVQRTCSPAVEREHEEWNALWESGSNK